MSSSTDRIERSILLQAPRARVWRALANAEEFGNWFGVALRGETFAPGQPARGHITYPGYEHLVFEIVVERLEPERLLSFCWHPAAIDVTQDYSAEPTTLVVFELEETSDGTLLRVVESGFDALPVARREAAFRLNDRGWQEQLQNIQAHVAAH